MKLGSLLIEATFLAVSRRREEAASAAAALVSLGDAGVPALANSLLARDGECRLGAALALQALGAQPETPEDRGWLQVGLRNWAGAVQLGAGAVPALICALRDPSPRFSQGAAQALRELRDPGAAPVLDLWLARGLPDRASLQVLREARTLLQRRSTAVRNLPLPTQAPAPKPGSLPLVGTPGDGEAVPSGAARAVSPEAARGPRLRPRSAGKPGGSAVEEPGARLLPGEFVWVPAGSFQRGTKEGDRDEQPVRRIRLTRGFWLTTWPITTAQYSRFLVATRTDRSVRRNPSRIWAGRRPVTGLPWAAAAAYCDWAASLVQAEGLAAVCRLPSEAEWEFAARGPRSPPFPWGYADPTACHAVYRTLWSGGRPRETRGREAGASWCGARDLVGNVWEWCADWYDREYYDTAPTVDPWNESPGTYRVARGGGWSTYRMALRTTQRLRLEPETERRDVGFRMAIAPGTGTSLPSLPAAPPTAPVAAAAVATEE